MSALGAGSLSLDLGFTEITDIKALSGMKSLRELDLSFTQVKNIKVLHRIEPLEVLRILDAPISNKNVSRFQRARPKCKIFDELG